MFCGLSCFKCLFSLSEALYVVCLVVWSGGGRLLYDHLTDLMISALVLNVPPLSPGLGFDESASWLSPVIALFVPRIVSRQIPLANGSCVCVRVFVCVQLEMPPL